MPHDEEDITMSDAGFKSAPYSAYTTEELKARVAHGLGNAKMTAELERRAKRDAGGYLCGDRSVMKDGERLHAKQEKDGPRH
jgi:hypothetical protein